MISEFGGLSQQMPGFATIFMIITMSSIGLPALNGFIGEFTILAGVFQLENKIWAIFAVTGIVLGAGYMLWLYQRTMFGKLDKPENQNMRDLNFREYLTLIPLVVLVFWIGLYPKPIFRILDKPVQKLVQQVRGTYYSAACFPSGPAIPNGHLPGPTTGFGNIRFHKAIRFGRLRWVRNP